MLDKNYNPKDFEEKIYEKWETDGDFKPDMKSDKDAFCIVIPPPDTALPRGKMPFIYKNTRLLSPCQPQGSAAGHFCAYSLFKRAEIPCRWSRRSSRWS